MKHAIAMLAAMMMLAGASAFAAGTAVDKDTEHFIKHAAMGNMAEIEAGKLAAGKATDADVKKFAEKMVADHTKANNDLKPIASKLGVEWPMQIDEKHMRMNDKLAKFSGPDFDKEFMGHMVKDHGNHLEKFQKEARAGKNPELRSYAEKTVTVIEDHLKQAREIYKKLGGQAAAEPVDKGSLPTSYRNWSSDVKDSMEGDKQLDAREIKTQDLKGPVHQKDQFNRDTSIPADSQLPSDSQLEDMRLELRDSGAGTEKEIINQDGCRFEFELAK